MNDELNLKDLEFRYQEAENQKYLIEKRLSDNQQEMDRITLSFETDLVLLKENQELLMVLKDEIFEAKKTYFKNMISSESFKKAFGSSIPLFSKLKESVSHKSKEIKDYLDGTTANNKWLDERYDEYKTISLSKGEFVKTKKEFQKIALTLKEVDEADDFSIHKIIGKTYHKVGNAKNSFVDLLNNFKSINSDNNNSKINSLLIETTPATAVKTQNNISLEKKDILSTWIKSKNIHKIKYANTSLNDLYDDYCLFTINTYGHQLDDLTYSLNNGMFKSALQRHFKTLIYDKNSKKINLK